MKTQVNISTGKVFQKKIFDKNIQLVPASAEVSIFSSDGTELLAAVDAEVLADGTLEYAIPVEDAAEYDVGENFKLVWDIILDDEDDTKVQEVDLFDICLTTVDIETLSAKDLFKTASYLVDLQTGKQGVATEGDTDELTDPELSENEGFEYKGCLVQIYEGTGEGQERLIVSFDAVNHTLLVSPDFVVEPDATSKYFVKRQFTTELQEGFEQVEEDLARLGKRISLVVDPAQIKRLILLKAAMIACFAQVKDPADKWRFRYDELNKSYSSILSSGAFVYDANEDGNIGSDETAATSQIQAVR